MEIIEQVKGTSGKLGVVAAISDAKILERDLLKSPELNRREYDYVCISGAENMAEAYNKGIDIMAKKDIIVFCHQDVYLPEAWLFRLLKLVREYPDNWGVVGPFGMKWDGTHSGRVWDSGLARELYFDNIDDSHVTSFDELVLVLNNKKGLRFDPNLPNFHLYGTDIALIATAMGLHNRVINHPVVHNSKAIFWLGRDYKQSYKYVSEKWQAQLPIHTPCCVVHKFPWPLYKKRYGLTKFRIKKKISNIFGKPQFDKERESPHKISCALGYEQDYKAE